MPRLIATRFARVATGALLLAVVVAIPLAHAGTGGSVSGPPAGKADGRPLGTFTMHATVTEAVNVRGEHRGQSLVRTWKLTPTLCAGNVCQGITLVRERAGHKHDTVRLTRTAPGVYNGSGHFWVALTCDHRRYAHGALAPFMITLRVTQRKRVQSTRFARRISATYNNRRRTNRTPCTFAPSHDAARYTGAATTALPGPPAVAFTDHRVSGRRFAFADHSVPGTGGAPIVSWSWRFGDAATGTHNRSTSHIATHTFSSNALYQVILDVVDANGLTGELIRAVDATPPGP